MRNRTEIPVNTPTCYEVALMRGEDILYSYGFTARKTKSGLLNLTATADTSSYLTAEELEYVDTHEAPWCRVRKGYNVAPNVYIRFSGRTEREVASL